MTTAYTSLLGLALPVTGELSGTWGDTVNTAITSLLDTAIAGTTSITTDADITLTTTTGASNQARQAIILWNPASGTVTRNITAPAQSKMYTVINASGGTQSIVIRGVGPTTGVTVLKGESALVAWNGSDFVKVSSVGGSATLIDLTVTGNTILGDAAADTLTVNATSTFAAPVSFQGLVRLPSTGRSAAAALTTTAPAFLYGVASTYTDTTSSGTIAAMAPFYSLAQPTLSTSNVTTYTNAATLYIANAPAAGGSATITNPYALYVAAGNAYFGDSMVLGSSSADTATVNATITSNLLFIDNTYDIGAAAATRPRNLYLAGAATLGTALTVPNGGTGLTSLTAGYIPFGAGTSALGNSANLFWDNSNVRLGVGTNAPAYSLDILKATGNDATIRLSTSAVGSAGAYLILNSLSSGFAGMQLQGNGTDLWYAGSYGTSSFQFVTGNKGSGTTLALLTTAGTFAVGTTSIASPSMILGYSPTNNATLSPNATLYLDRNYGTAGDSAVAIRTTLNGGAGGLYISGYNGNAWFGHNVDYLASSGYVARYTDASRIDLAGGVIAFYSNTGLTAGSVFTPTERARFSTSGNFGIGTTNPTAIVHTSSSGLGDTGGIKIQNAGSGGGTFAVWPTATVNGEGANKLVFSGSVGNIMAIEGTSGNILLGAPGSNAASQRLTFSNATGGLGIGFGDVAGNYSNIFSAYSSGAQVLAAGLQGSTSADTYTSSYGGSMFRSAIRLNTFSSDGIQFFANGSSTVARGTAITPTEVGRFSYSGQFLIGTTTTTQGQLNIYGTRAYQTLQNANNSGKMFGRVYGNGGTGGQTINIMTVTGWQSGNSRIFGTVTIYSTNAVGNSGNKTEAYFFANQAGSTAVGSMTTLYTYGGMTVGSLTWSGLTLQYITPGDVYAFGSIDIEWAAGDGAYISYNV